MTRIVKIILVFLFLLITFVVCAAQIKLSWVANDASIAKYNIYYKTNNSPNIFKLSEKYPTNYVNLEIKPSLPYTFWVTSENKLFIESSASSQILYIYPAAIPPPLYLSLTNSGGSTSNAWINVKISWENPNKLFATRNFYLHLETSSSTNIYNLKTNSYTVKSIPFNNYRIYAEAENVLGKSKVSKDNTVLLNKANSKPIFKGKIRPDNS